MCMIALGDTRLELYLEENKPFLSQASGEQEFHQGNTKAVKLS